MGRLSVLTAAESPLDLPPGVLFGGCVPLVVQLLAPAQACAQQAQFIADSVRTMYLKWFGNAVAAGASLAQMGTPLYAVCGEIMSSLEEENTINPTAAGSEEDAEREALFE